MEEVAASRLQTITELQARLDEQRAATSRAQEEATALRTRQQGDTDVLQQRIKHLTVRASWRFVFSLISAAEGMVLGDVAPTPLRDSSQMALFAYHSPARVCVVPCFGQHRKRQRPRKLRPSTPRGC